MPHPGISESTQLDTLARACTAQVQEYHCEILCTSTSLADLDKQWSAFYQALQTSVTLGTCSRDPTHQGSSALQDLSPTGLGKQLQVGTTLQTSLAILCSDQGSEAFTLPTTRTSTQCRLTSQMHPVVRTLALPKEHIGCGACSSFLASTAK